MDDVNAVCMLELQQRRNDAHTAIDERVPDDLAILPLDKRIRDVRLPVGVSGPTLVGTRAVEAELETESRLDAVDPQKKFRHASDPAAC